MASSYDKTLLDHFGIQTTKHLSRKSSLLKDYLRDDLSSCSSSGFKSYPRRQCCTTMGQLKRRINTTIPPRPSSTSSSKISALHRASEAMINTFKSIPLSQKSAKAKKAATGFLARSFSRKVLFSSRRFWKKATKEKGIVSEGSSITRRLRRSFRELLMEERDKTTSNEDIMFIVNVSTTTTTTTTSSGCGSNKSWGESEFTFSSCESSAEKENVVEGTKEVVTSDDVEGGVTTRDWQNEEKEQLSPVSILDCPFEDDEEITSNFNSTTEGNQHKHKQKRLHFENVASLEPVTLEKRIARLELEDETYESRSSLFPSPVLMPIMYTQNVTTNVLDDHIEENALDLLNFAKKSIPTNCLITKLENLLFDYFKQSIEENHNIDHSKKLHLCEVAEDGIIGQPQELYLGWEVKEGRHVYIREMDKEWKNYDQETQKVALELENEVLTSLVNELVLDLTMQQVSSSIVFSIL